MIPIPWTDEEKIILAKMWEEGNSGREIAHTLNRSRNAILGMANRLQLPKHKTLTRKKAEGERKPIKPIPQRIIAEPHRMHPTNLPRTTPKGPTFSDSIQIVPTSSGVAFIEMKDSLCHAIVGRDSVGDKLVRYCGIPAKEGSAYCTDHHSRYYYRRDR